MKCSCEEFQENYSSCTSCSHGQQISVQENGRKYILRNLSSKKLCRVKVDGCIISSQTMAKCDYLIVVCKSSEEADDYISSVEDVYFVELKGKDLIRAVEQLTQTIEYFQSHITGKIFARAVLSKVANPSSIENDARVVKLRRLLRSHSGDFAYGSRQYDNDRI